VRRLDNQPFPAGQSCLGAGQQLLLRLSRAWPAARGRSRNAVCSGRFGTALTLPVPPSAGFDAEVRKANASEIGRRNGGAMLSMQVTRFGCFDCPRWPLRAAVWHLCSAPAPAAHFGLHGRSPAVLAPEPPGPPKSCRWLSAAPIQHLEAPCSHDCRPVPPACLAHFPHAPSRLSFFHPGSLRSARC
jgi:hypothetical protein